MSNFLTVDNHISREIKTNDQNSSINGYSVEDMSIMSISKLESQAKKQLKWYESRSFIRLCATIWYIIILATIGIIVVCVSQPDKTARTCTKVFKNKIKHVFTYDSRPQKIAVGHFNRDNHLDFVVSEKNAYAFGVFLGYGNGTFSSEIPYSTGDDSYPHWVAVGDFNDDSSLDIAVAEYGTHTVDLFLGDGDGNFSYESEFNMGPARPMFLAVADFNQDNRLDIAVVSNGTLDVSILLGLGDGSFEMELTYYLGHDCVPYSIDVADFNYDNQTDILIVDYGTSNLIVLLNIEDGYFSMEKYSTGHYTNPCSVALGDFNNDTLIDLVVVFSTVEIILMLAGDGNGTFKVKEESSSGAGSSQKVIATGRFNRDNSVDLIIVDSRTSNIIVLNGLDNGKFVVATTRSTGYNSYPISIAVSDIDYDNISDAIVVNNGVNSILSLTSYTISLTSKQTTNSPDPEFVPISMVVCDINLDGKNDVVVADSTTNSVMKYIGKGNGNFDIKIAISGKGESDGPFLIGVGDFNNDHRPDIIMNMFYTNEIRIYLGLINDSFTKIYTDRVGEEGIIYSMTIGDFNGDNNVDVVVASEDDGSLAVLLGYGNGVLEEPLYCAPINSYQMLIFNGDFNSDNRLDLAFANSDSHTLIVSLGKGNGTFEDPIFFSIESYNSRSLAIGYIDKDSILDIVVTIPDYFLIGIFFGNGDGTFRRMQNYSIDYEAYPYAVVLDDFNKDGFSDIAVLVPDVCTIIVFYNKGDGTFPKSSTILIEDAIDPFLMATGYFDEDNNVDIVVGNAGSNDISLLLLRYQPNFYNESILSVGSGAHPSSVAVGDFNNDGQIDIAATYSGQNQVTLFIGYRNNDFTNRIPYSTGANSHPQQVVVADFNRDDKLDIAVVNAWNNNLRIFLLSTDADGTTSHDYSTGARSSPNALAVGDFNKDGWNDIVVVNKGIDNIGIFLGYDYPTFEHEIIPIRERNSNPTFVIVGDFNKDSQMDIAVACLKKNNISVFLGYGDGSFAAEISNPLPAYSYPAMIAHSDFNNDNKPDIAVANSRGKTISVLLGDGNGKFAAPISKSTGKSLVTFIDVNDFNRDNRQDIAVAFEKDNYIGIFLGYGNGSFAEPIKYNMPNESSPIWIISSDWNNDSIPDIAIANVDGDNIGVLLGVGNGNFRNINEYSTGIGSGPCSIAKGDFNKDNRMDIVVANRLDSTIGIFFGYSNGTFSLQATYAIDASSSITSIIVGDVNNDTILDIIYSCHGGGSSNVGILYGLKAGTFLVSKSYSTGVTEVASSIAMADFDNDGRQDFVVSNKNKNSMSIMIQHTSEPFGEQKMIFTGDDSQPYSVTVDDFNNDNQLDIAVASAKSNSIIIFTGNGDGSFTSENSYDGDTDAIPKFITTADFDKDKNVDIIVADSKKCNICIFRGHGNGSFTLSKCYSTGLSSEPSSIAIADLNRDNETDLVVTNTGINTLLVFYGIGNGTFATPKSNYLGFNARPMSAAISDFDNDSSLDIVVTNDDWGYIDVLLQTC